MYTYEYNDSEAIIYLIDRCGTRSVLNSDMASKPVLSKDGSLIAYISPLAWETIGDVYVTDLKTGKTEKVYVGSSELTPKYLRWKSNDVIFFILGYTYGTVSVGGDIYKLDLKRGRLDKIVETSDKIEITSFEFKDEEKNILILSGIEYTDENLNEFREYRSHISLSEELAYVKNY